MERFEAAFRSLFQVNMGVIPGERIVVFSDLIRKDEAPSPADADRRERLLAAGKAAADHAAREYGSAAFVSFPATAASGAEPPEPLWRVVFGEGIVDELAREGLFGRLLRKEATAEDLERASQIVAARRGEVARVIVAMANNSTSHTRFRGLVNAAGGRFASLPGFDPEMFFGSMCVDWGELARRTDMLANAINSGDEIIVTTPNGTSMRFDTTGRTAAADNGLLAAPGSFGNLPAGEVFLAPRERTSEGVMVLEFAPTRPLSSPIVLTVRGGEVVDVRGDDPHRQHLEEKFAQSVKNRNIAELGIGTNDRATRPDNILEAEKILGTIHIALGDNSGFGGLVQTPFHEDYVFYRPTLVVVQRDGSRRVVLEDGKLLV